MKHVQTFKEFVNENLNEASSTKYYVEFCGKVGGHSDNGKSYSDFKTAIKDAEKSYKEELKNGTIGEDSDEMDYTIFIGVGGMGMGSDFAIIFCTKEYLKDMNEHTFDSEKDFKTYYKACEENIKTGKTVIGKF